MTRRMPATRSSLIARATLATIAALLLSAPVNTLLADDSPLRLNFGVYSSNKPSAMVKVFKPTLQALEARMSDKLGREVDIRMQIAKDYDKGISDLTEGKVDFSRFGPASYTEAKRINDGLRILAMEAKNGIKVFYGIIAVRSDSNITDITQLRDRSFAFGDEGSTIGRFLSQLRLEQAGIHANDLSRYEYLGRHDKVGTAVGAGAFDAGALNESTFKKLVDKGEPIRELVRFPNVTKPWIARAGLDPVVFNALQSSLIELKGNKVLAKLKIDGFLPGDDADYAEIRDAIGNNAAFFEDSVEPAATNYQTATEPELKAANAVTTITSESASAFPDGISRDGNRITVNITLPASVFKSDKESGNPNLLTINVRVPELDTTTPASESAAVQ